MCPDSCFDSQGKLCPFIRTQEEWCDWGFALTSRYGFLYHHKPFNHDTYGIRYEEIIPDKKHDTDDDEEWEEYDRYRISQEENPSGKEYKIYQYIINYSKPVGELEDLVREHVRNCILNDIQFLTPTALKDNNRGRYTAKDLSMLLLQELHLPATQRVIRQSKKILSENPEYAEKYKSLLLNSMHISFAEDAANLLSEIAQKHSLGERFLHHRITPNRSYVVDISIEILLEYELKTIVLENSQEDLARLIDHVFPKDQFLYRAFDKRLIDKTKGKKGKSPTSP